MKTLTASVAVTLLVGCVSPSIGVLSGVDAGAEHPEKIVRKSNGTMSAERLVGAYRYSDGFWSWEMHLIPRGRYEVFAVTDILVESEDGKLKRDTYRVAHGGWTVDAGSVVLRRDDGIANFWAVVLVGGRVALMEPSESRGLHRLFTRTNRPVTIPNKPNQAADPTPTPVTISDDAELAPAAVVAHL